MDMLITTTFEAILSGSRFKARGSTWEKRADNLGADLVDRHGNVSFMSGKRHIEEFKDGEFVEYIVPAVGRAALLG